MPKARVDELIEQIQNGINSVPHFDILNGMAIQIFNPDMEADDEENVEIHDELLILMIQVLDFMYKSNLQNPRAPVTDFQNPACSDNLNMTFIAKQYYSSKQQKQKQGEDRFVFLDYPWLFSTAAKVEAIQKESNFNMQNTIGQMMDEDGHIVVENFFNIDQVIHLQIQVRRNNLLDDSLRMLGAQSKNYKKPLKIKFMGEEGVDQGGVKKEFFTLLMKELFNPAYAMFEPKFNERFLWFNKLSVECNINFELIGTLLALAIYNSVLLSAPFPRVVYKKLLSEPTDLEDLKEFEPELYATMRNILTCGKVDEMGLTFSTSYDNFGYEEIVEFVEVGQTVSVTEANKHDFVRLYVDWYLNRSVEPQFSGGIQLCTHIVMKCEGIIPFYKGFYKVISQESIKLLDSAEVIKLICGVDEIDIEELQKSTSYDNCSEKDTTVVWFWEVVKELDDEQKRNLLKFTTGSDRTPLRGLAELNFVIMVQGLDDSRLPSAHTCFNHLILPQYSSKDALRLKLLQAIQNHEGFGLM